MTADEALVRLKAMLDWEADPALSPEEVDTLLSMSKIADRYGLWPSDTSWTPTYNLNIGAAEGWRWKAARAESLEGGNVTSEAVGDVRVTYASGAERFQAKADMYSKRIHSSPSVGRRPWGYDDAVIPGL